MNKILLPATANSLNAELDGRFGRAPYFIVYDISRESFVAEENRTDRNADQGAGIQSAMKAVDLGVDAVVAVHCGPKAFRVLHEAGIRVFLSPPTTVSEAIQAFRNGTLDEAGGANVEGHW